MKVGGKIKKIRELRNFTQEYMAEKLNISQSTYSRFEKNDYDITVSQLNNIAEQLGVSTEELLNFNEKTIFNNYGNQYQVAQKIENHGIEEIKKLYEDKIQLLEDKIRLLEKLYAQQ
ncbi:MAG: helix-turn-helix transcriptional regulator [Cytophagales bacterium]